MSLIKTRPFDAANYLRDEADVAAYLQAAVEDGDPALLAAVLGDIARARGMTQLARDTGLSRESLYKSLSGERAPSSETLFKVLHALGFKLTLLHTPPAA
ncbi:putative addiction module antidote protein [Melaminivora suipulveris]|uniref:Putative addiction module antidote protein n=1 Tax=Melaminivora suipulveris TaxID=2109913 RepID=A0A2R3QD87_9BURK|nr:addiction module antidote protein [Melaminivora suipulveris]AVO49732.1 putative addiction module antidote protein [Melaminivora suipulveris]